MLFNKVLRSIDFILFTQKGLHKCFSKSQATLDNFRTSQIPLMLNSIYSTALASIFFYPFEKMFGSCQTLQCLQMTPASGVCVSGKKSDASVCIITSFHAEMMALRQKQKMPPPPCRS